jgi:hypothetical protein
MMGKGVIMLVCFVIASAISVADETVTAAATDSYDKRDVDALLCFKKAIIPDPLGLLSNWTAQNAENVCSWEGIRCRKQTRRVVGIVLQFSTLEGALSPCLGNLSLLHSMDISGNILTERIPPEFGRLKALRYLQLGNNQLSGSIPVEAIPHLSKLVAL